MVQRAVTTPARQSKGPFQYDIQEGLVGEEIT